MEHTEFLTEELKKLVGWGAAPQRLPLLPQLRSLARVDEEVPLVTMGYLIRRFLVDQINSLTGTYDFMGKAVEAERMKRAYRLLLMIEGRGSSAVNRRGKAIMALDMYFSVEQWRRPCGPEREFLAILAEHMCQTTEPLPN
jgi:hypothetical protein